MKILEFPKVFERICFCHHIKHNCENWLVDFHIIKSISFPLKLSTCFISYPFPAFSHYSYHFFVRNLHILTFTSFIRLISIQLLFSKASYNIILQQLLIYHLLWLILLLVTFHDADKVLN